MIVVNGMSFTFIVRGVGGSILVDCRTLCTGDSFEELSKKVSSGEVELCKHGRDASGGYGISM